MSNGHKLLVFLMCGLFAASPFAYAQQEKCLAIIPTFHDRLNTYGVESPLKLQRQQFIVFVYRNAVAVYTEADFVNTGSDSLSQEFGLPSTGHDENGDELSSGILSVQTWIQGERVASDVIHEDNVDWYTIRSQFAPGEQHKVKAVYWAQTSLTDVDSLPGLDTVAIAVGKRGFMVDLSHASVWNDVIESIDVTVVLKGGMSFQRDSFSAEPTTYDFRDSTIAWSLKNVEPSVNDNILILYAPSGSWGQETNTMVKLSAYIVKKAYIELLSFAEQADQE